MSELPSKSLFSGENAVLRKTLRAERRRLRLTQAEVAARCGWQQSVIAKIEQGERRVDVVEFLWLAGALRVEPVGLLQLVLKKLSEEISADVAKLG